MLVKVSSKWLAKSLVYKRFAKDWEECCDFSEEAAEAFYAYESRGTPRVVYSEKQPNGLFNGFAVGKHWWDVTVAMWKEDLAVRPYRVLTEQELGDDYAYCR